MSTRDPENSQNILIALVLSMLVLFAWQYFYAGPKITAEKERMAREAPAGKPAESGTKAPGDVPRPAAQPEAPAAPGAPTAPGGQAAVPGSAPSPTPSTTRSGALAGSPRVAIKTPAIIG